MKKILLTLMVLFVTIMVCKSQSKNESLQIPVDSTTKLITYSEVIQEEGLTKDELYVRAREWYAKTFVSARYVIQMDDKAAGKIIGKGSSEGTYNILLTLFRYDLNYTISVTVKDGRYRYEISQFSIEDAGRITPAEGYLSLYNKGKGMGSGTAKKIIPHLDYVAKKLAISLKDALHKPATGIKSKDDF